jgi:isopenicillin-N epimerase
MSDRAPFALSRRTLLKFSGAAALAATTGAGEASAQSAPDGLVEDWQAVRDLFPLSRERIHMSAMLISSHPAPVAEAIERHRAGLDADPVRYLEANYGKLTEAARTAAGRYLGVHPSHVALTDSTTMGVGLVYGGFPLQEGDDVLTTTEDYYVTHESLRLAAARAGASIRKVALYEEAAKASADAIVGRIARAVKPATRLVAITWVHSSTGMKLPVARIAAALDEINADRDEADHVLLGVDGVHAFGIEDFSFERLGCDFLMAGCHKWLFGPRGTGIVAVSSRGLQRLRPIIPSFTDDSSFDRWITGADEPTGANNGRRLTPGGFKTFEHHWALAQAIELHERIGREKVATRTHDLASMLKEELGAISGISIATPRSEDLSAGIVSFDVEGQGDQGVVSRLRERGIIASVAPYATSHVRLTPSIRNSEAEIQEVAAALSEIA